MAKDLEFYRTPTWATATLLDRLGCDGSVLEPCSGDGAITEMFRSGARHVTTNDIDVEMDADYHLDASDPASWVRWNGRFDWIVSNPPFSKAHAIVPLAVDAAISGVAMLLRLSWLEPCKNRAGWLSDNPPRALFVLPRMSFTGDGKTDSVTCAWMVWTKLDAAPTGVEVVRYRSRVTGNPIPFAEV